jgi:hypothetical protein
MPSPNELRASIVAPIIDASRRAATVSTEIDWFEKQRQWSGLHPTNQDLSMGTPISAASMA